MRSSNVFLAVTGALFFSSSSQAYFLIDTFEQGYHKATITGEGNQDFFVDGLDKSKVYAGHRYTDYIVNGNPFGYTTTFEVGLGEARVTTPGPNDLSTELIIQYGSANGMDLDLSNETKFEVDLQTEPGGLLAETWGIYLSDSLGRGVSNLGPGTRQGGIEFYKSGFVGNPNFDWSDVYSMTFRQSWNRTQTAPLSYWATEIRTVPEPGVLMIFGVGIFALGRKKQPRV